MKNRWVVGSHAVVEALVARPDWVQTVYCLEGKAPDSRLEGLCHHAQCKVQSRGKKFFAGLSSVHQGVAAELSQRPRFSWSPQSEKKNGEKSEPKVLAYLDGLKDPHNLGAILRSSWLLGVSGIFVPNDHSVGLTPTVAKVACGGAEHVPIESCHFGKTLKDFKDQGFWVYGASPQAQKSISEIELSPQAIFVMGSEAKGMRRSTEKLCDELVRLPQVVSGHSFNASVAFSLTIYEYTRQHQILENS